MASAETLVYQFLQDQDDIKDRWWRNVVNPYATAFENALHAYEETLKKQKEADEAAAKARFEILMLVLSLCSGGLLTAAFGTAVVRTIVTDRAMNMIYNHNMERAFTLAHILSTNKTAGFIAGKVWDEAEKRAGEAITDAVKKRMEETPANYPSIQNVRSVGMKSSLENFVLDAKLKGSDIARDILANQKLGEQQKIDQLAKIKTSRFYTPPMTAIDATNGALADEIELSMYLGLVLKSDTLNTIVGTKYEKFDTGPDSFVVEMPVYQTSEITDSVYSKEYVQHSVNVMSGKATITYMRLGDVIRGKLNKLYKAKFKEDFIGKENLDGRWIGKAENALKTLASDNALRNIQGLSK